MYTITVTYTRQRTDDPELFAKSTEAVAVADHVLLRRCYLKGEINIERIGEETSVVVEIEETPEPKQQ